MKTLYVFDLDGVLFDNHHREDLIPEDKSKTENWAAFNQQCVHDAPITHMWELLRELIIGGSDVIFLTGRSDACRLETIASLAQWLSFYGTLSDRGPALSTDTLLATVHQRLFMRAADDHRPAREVKSSWVANNLPRLTGILSSLIGACGDIVLVDDDLSIIQACRETGVFTRTIHVTPFSGCIAYQGSISKPVDALHDRAFIRQDVAHLLNTARRLDSYGWPHTAIPVSVLQAHFITG